MTKGPETKFSERVQKILRDRGWYVIKHVGTGASKWGVADLLCCAQGRFVAIELKSCGGRVDELQTEHKKMVEDAGGVSLLIRE